MKHIIELEKSHKLDNKVKLEKAYKQFSDILTELREKDLPDNVIEEINKEIEDLNKSTNTGKVLKNQIVTKVY